MMDHYVITIGRQFGSLGRSIAKELSQRLGIEYYDRDIVEKTAKELNMSVGAVDYAEGRTGTSSFWKRAFPLGEDVEKQDQIFAAQARIIGQLAEKESCIFVGRCADYILKGEPRKLSVFIYAPSQARIRNCVERLGMEEKEARRMMKSIDSARKDYHKKYTGYSSNDLEKYDLMINSATMGVEGTVDYLETLIRMKFYSQEEML